MQTLDASYWNERYQQHQTRWDLGIASPPLARYIDQLDQRHIQLLIPGAGNAHEAAYLCQHGFEHVTVVDISDHVCQQLRQRYAPYVAQGCLQVVCSDFFEHQQSYDLILEQTFFCALPPHLRPLYAQHTQQLLRPKGRLVGVLFNRIFEPSDDPPFGGSPDEYRSLFEAYYHFHSFEACYNSVAPRQGFEWFINLQKK